MCNFPGHPFGCNCDSFNGFNQPFVNQWVTPCSPCAVPGPCPIKLDTQCIIYHKDNNSTSGLVGLGLNNGATLQLILDTIDLYIRTLKVVDWTLPCLRATYAITTLQQFGQSVDTQLCVLQGEIDDLVASAAVPITANDSSTVHFTVGGTLDHTITADVKVSSAGTNLIGVLSDGLVVAPQTLGINYSTKELSISDGNTVSFASLVCGVGGYLGEFTSDPSAIDGQYWYRTDLSANSGLKIKLHGVVKTITIS